MIPVPGHVAGTPYGQRGKHWSCDRDANGNGIHTGVDYPAPIGTLVVAARPGVACYCNHGSAFGDHQLEVRCDDGTRDFFAHMSTRSVADGATVIAGQSVGKIGDEGNVTGSHLHFERHATTTGGWSCAVVRDPAPSIDYIDEDEMTDDDWTKLRGIVHDEVVANNKAATDSVWDEALTVTKPNGQDEQKSARQVLRETWQRVAKLAG